MPFKAGQNRCPRDQIDTMNSKTDITLLERVQAQDEAAITELVQKHLPGLRRFLAQYNLDWETAGELALETMVRVIKQLPGLRDLQKFRPWLLSIARCLALDEIRRESRRLHPLQEESVEGDNLLEQVGPSQEPPLWSEYESILSETRELMAGLPESARMLLVSKYHEELSYQEIADRTGLSVIQVKARLARARKKLREQMASLVEDWRRICNELSR